jgi:hypothetical protein
MRPAVSAACLLVLLSAPASAQTTPLKPSSTAWTTLGVAAGAPGETDFACATEIATVLSTGQEVGPNGETAFRFVPTVSAGGSRLRDVLSLADVDLGIAPKLFLDRARDAKTFGNLQRSIVIITPLFTEELHVVAAPRIRSLDQLAGQAVDVGPVDGVSQMAARDLFAAAGIHIEEAHRDPEAALEALKQGEVAAVVLLSGKPVPALADLSGADAHLLAVPPAAFPLGYLPARIIREDYPALLTDTESVSTPALGSVLFAYRWPATRRRHEAIEALVIALFSRLADLQAPPRHPKWREVNLAAATPGWDRFQPAARWLKRRPPLSEAALRQEFDRYLARSGLRPANPGDRDHLFDDFVRSRNRSSPESEKETK